MKHNSAPVTHRILVIDDNVSIHEDFCKILRGSRPNIDAGLAAMEESLFGTAVASDTGPCFEVDCATQGEEGLALLQKAKAEGRPYALAFVDGRMPPGWDGVETIQHLWQEAPELQVVLATAYADYSWQEIQRELGTTDGLLILKKPFDNVEVLQMAHTLTRKWELTREINGRLNSLAFFDQLTGLPNRTLFMDRFNQALASGSRRKSRLALIFIDLDNFKRINDSLGHSFGDTVLTTVAQRLESCLRATDTVSRCTASRLGGDEFTVLVSDLEKNEFAAVVAQRIAHEVAKPIIVGDHQIIITPSMGIALFPEDGRDAETLLKNADLAMYYAKRTGPNAFTFFQESMNSLVLQRLTLESQLRLAIERAELSLVYQPQLSLERCELRGVEALLRWNNSELGNVPPQEFIQVAEECGLIASVGEWVLHTACSQAKAWIDQGLALPLVAVNVSIKQFNQPDFVQTVKAVLSESGLPPGRLELEVTESLIETDFDQVAAKLSELRSMSVQIALDDFGQGYSSLARLKKLPIDSLKIDRAFVSGIDVSAGDRTLINAIIAMASGLGLSTVAEGVETHEQLKYLKRQKCKDGQGYLFSRPLSAKDAEWFLRQLLGGKALDSGLLSSALLTVCEPNAQVESVGGAIGQPPATLRCE